MKELFLVLLVLGGGYVVTMNWLCIFANVRNMRAGIDRYHSFAPLVGPLFLTVGLGLLFPGLGWFLLLPWLVDPGTWILLYSIPFLSQPTEGGRG